jgi:glycosyltransferase involved in cell wall biosynthesis
LSEAGLVSVLVPCYNAERFVAQALESLLGQTYKNVEIYALDDGSTDSTATILAMFAERDSRIEVIRSDVNRGLIATLNHGVAAAEGEFIARLDADDIAAPDRLALQLALLRGRPEISVVGSGANVIDAVSGRWRRPQPARCFDPAGAEFMSLFATPISHPTMVARVEAMRDHPYGVGAASLHVEDYELFARMLFRGIQFANLPEPLVTRRADPAGVSGRHEATQIANFVLCAREHLARVTGLSPSLSTHRTLLNRIDQTVTASDLTAGLRLLDTLESRALGVNDTAAAADISRVAAMQRIDILAQAAIRGSRSVRMAAARLAHGYRWFIRSQAARSYLLTKVPRR